MFLIDQNLSRRLVALLGSRWSGARHVLAEGLDQATDTEIWDQARELGLTVLTKDHDFEALAIANGPPPRVVILAIGNCTTDEAANVMFANADLIESFLHGDDSVLVLTRPKASGS